MVDNQSRWGRRTARERYGALPTPNMTPKDEDASYPQKLGDPNNLRGPDWKDDHPNDWVRGAGESAEGKPDFKNSQGYNGGRK